MTFAFQLSLRAKRTASEQQSIIVRAVRICHEFSRVVTVRASGTKRGRLRKADSAGMAPKEKGRSMLWFRKGLRLHDNPALLDAISDADSFFPVFCHDPHFYSEKPVRVGVNRISFLFECLTDLDESLKARGSRLLVRLLAIALQVCVLDRLHLPPSILLHICREDSVLTR